MAPLNMDLLPGGASRSPTPMASLPCSPIRCATGRQPLENAYNDNLSNYSEGIPPLTTDAQIDPVSSADVKECTSSKDEHDNMRCFSPTSQSSCFNEEDSMELSNVDVASLASNAGGESEGETIEDIMNIPYTTVVPVPVQDFSSLYPSDESVSDEAEPMRSYREQIQQKLRKQLLAQENESKAANAIESTEIYAPQHSGGDDENGVAGTDVLNSLDGADIQGIKDEAEYFRDLFREPVPLCGGLETLTPSGDTERQTSASFRERSLSTIELNSDPCITLQAPDGLSSSATSSRKSIGSSRSGEFKATSPSKRRRKASSPDELAELARVAAIEEAEAEEEAALKELEKYREMDLAPLEPVMESNTAGDLIVHGTPVKAQDTDIFRCKYRIPKFKILQTTSGRETRKGMHLQLPTPPRGSLLHTEKNEEHDADIKISSVAMQSPGQHQVMSHADHPPFIHVIEALPATMFWCTAAAITKCSMNAFDTLIERLTGLNVNDTQSSSD